jgi:23S rRNA (cytosine1962-C5)-methyltransferase
MNLSSSSSYPLEDFEYRLLDSGEFQKLERFGEHHFIRPSPQAIWPKSLPDTEWHRADGEYKYFKGKETGGEWKFFSKLPKDGWPLKFRDLTFKIKPTGFGHIGMFPEQALNWIWIDELIRSSNRTDLNILNIFGYTGASTLAVAGASAAVTHVDASKASVTWARNNLELSGLGERPVRWIVDDALKFLKREHRRGRRYDGIIMDPPTFGRGPGGEVWKIENQLSELMLHCKQVLSEHPLFILLTTHSPGFSALTLQNMVCKFIPESASGVFETGEMFIHDTGSRLHLPSGFFSRWHNDSVK